MAYVLYVGESSAGLRDRLVDDQARQGVCALCRAAFTVRLSGAGVKRAGNLWQHVSTLAVVMLAAAFYCVRRSEPSSSADMSAPRTRVRLAGDMPNSDSARCIVTIACLQTAYCGLSIG